MKSNEGEINMVESTIVNKNDILKVLNHMTNLIPMCVPIKFAIRDHAEAFVRQYVGSSDFSDRILGFCCNLNQSDDERASFKYNFDALYDVSLAPFEIGNFDGIQVAIRK